MAEKNLIDKIEQYFNQQREVSGDYLYFNEIKEDKEELKEHRGNSEEKTKLLDDPDDLFTEREEWMEAKDLDELYDKIHNCTKCPLGFSRTKFVFGAGNPNADIMVIGEAPGRDEDLQGEPFVGRAGQLLTKILAAIGFKREDVFIGNIIKCRPPENRRPEQSEIDECEPYLKKQIELINPEFILALGLTAVDSLLKKKHVMRDTRGKVLDYHGIKTMVTYHPAALLRNPNLKKLTWEDVKELRKMYDESVGN